MKNLFKIGLLALVIVVLSPSNSFAKRGVWGNGDVEKETRNIRSFNAIDISSAFEVELTQGNTESLVIEADENIMENIITEVVGGTLKIYVKGNVRKVEKMKAYISFKMIDEIETSGAVDLKGMNKMKFNDLFIDSSGASDIELELTAKELKLDFSGATEINLIGYADALFIDSSGASDIKALDFEVKRCEVDASGASTIKVFVTDELEVEASGATTVRYKGRPAVDIDTSGASSVRRY